MAIFLPMVAQTIPLRSNPWNVCGVGVVVSCLSFSFHSEGGLFCFPPGMWTLFWRCFFASTACDLKENISRHDLLGGGKGGGQGWEFFLQPCEPDSVGQVKHVWWWNVFIYKIVHNERCFASALRFFIVFICESCGAELIFGGLFFFSFLLTADESSLWYFFFFFLNMFNACLNTASARAFTIAEKEDLLWCRSAFQLRLSGVR